MMDSQQRTFVKRAVKVACVAAFLVVALVFCVRMVNANNPPCTSCCGGSGCQGCGGASSAGSCCSGSTKPGRLRVVLRWYRACTRGKSGLQNELQLICC